MSLKIEIRQTDTANLDGDAWNDYDSFSAHPANTTFYAGLYRGRLLSAPIFLEAFISGDKVSQWVLAKRRSRQNPFSVELSSPCAPQVAQKHTSQFDEIFAAYIEFMNRSFHPENITVFNYALTRGITEAALLQSGFSRVERFCTFVNQLGEDDELLRQFHGSHRNDTRRALRLGFSYTPILSFEEYLHLSKETYARSDQSGPSEREVLKLQRELVEHHKGLISGVSVDGTLEAASIVLFHGEHAYYLHGASSNERSRGATTLIHYENMRLLRRRGVRFYDFGGARIANDVDAKARSISAFKSRFGGTLIEAFGGIYR